MGSLRRLSHSWSVRAVCRPRDWGPIGPSQGWQLSRGERAHSPPSHPHVCMLWRWQDPFPRRGTRASERLSHLPKVAQLASGRART